MDISGKFINIKPEKSATYEISDRYNLPAETLEKAKSLGILRQPYSQNLKKVIYGDDLQRSLSKKQVGYVQKKEIYRQDSLCQLKNGDRVNKSLFFGKVDEKDNSKINTSFQDTIPTTLQTHASKKSNVTQL